MILFKKFKTRKHHYLYVTCSNEIYQIDKEIYEKWEDLVQMLETKIPNPSINNKVIERFTSGITENDVLKEESFLLLFLSDTKEKLLNKRQRLIIEISQDCNNRCYYCTYSGKYSTHRVHRGVSMTFDIAIKAIEDFLEHSVDAKVRAITFYGGEPLLEFELIKQIIAYLENKGIECYFSISTNGVLLTEEIIDWLVSNKFKIQVSIDGPKEIHDRYRTSKDGQSTYEIIFNNLLSLDRKYPSYLRINGSIVITLAPPFVLKEIFNWASTEFLKHFSFDYISWVITTVSLKNINPEKYWDLNFDVLNRDIEELKVYLLDKIDNKELSSNELSFFKSWILDSLLPIYKRDLRDISDNYKPGLLGCIPGNDRVFVTSNGDYYTCERVNEAFKIGSVETGINLDMVNKLQLQIQDFLSFCESCWAKRICQTCLSSLEKKKLLIRIII